MGRSFSAVPARVRHVRSSIGPWVAAAASTLLLIATPATAASTTTIVPYGASGYSYKVVATGAEPGFQAPSYPEVGFAAGAAAFGSGVVCCGCPLQTTVKTAWPLNTDVLVRRRIDLPRGTSAVRIGIAIDNDVVVYWNGVRVGSLVHEFCPERDSLVVNVPDGRVQAGTNVLAVRGVDRDGESLLDIRVSAVVGRQAAFTLDPATDADGNPDGVAFDKRSGAFFVSRVATGAISRGTLGDPTVHAFIPGVATPGQSPLAAGLTVRDGKLYVAGATTGTIRIYDIATKALLRRIRTRAPGDTSPTFVNDLAVDERGDVFATDSFRPVIYRVDGRSGALSTIDVSPKIPLILDSNGDPAINLNGIVAKDEDQLIVVNTAAGKLFRIELGDDDHPNGPGAPEPDIHEIKLSGGTIAGGDGLLIDRGQLIVVQASNPAVRGGAHGVLTFIDVRQRARGTVVGNRTDATLAGPSTVMRARNRLLVVNANFAGDGPPFTVSALPRGA
jgi:Cu-Zn family superoxide dismutase